MSGQVSRSPPTKNPGRRAGSAGISSFFSHHVLLLTSSTRMTGGLLDKSWVTGRRCRPFCIPPCINMPSFSSRIGFIQHPSLCSSICIEWTRKPQQVSYYKHVRIICACGQLERRVKTITDPVISYYVYTFGSDSTLV